MVKLVLIDRSLPNGEVIVLIQMVTNADLSNSFCWIFQFSSQIGHFHRMVKEFFFTELVLMLLTMSEVTLEQVRKRSVRSLEHVLKKSSSSLRVTFIGVQGSSCLESGARDF